MAGQSEKKRATNASATVALYKQIILALYVVYILGRVVLCWSSFGFWILLGFLLISTLNYFCLQLVAQALEMGTPVSGPQDVLFVNWAVMALSVLSDKAFYLYLVIPAYLIYQYGGIVKGYLFPPKMKMPQQDTTEADAKRAAKKERQAAMNERRMGGRS